MSGALPGSWSLLVPACLIAACAGPPGPAGRAAEPIPSVVDIDSARSFERVWPVMGTVLRVVVWDADSARAVAAMRVARAEVMRVDSLMSNYRDDSDVARVNRAAGSGRWTEVSAATVDVLLASLAHARTSGGAFDPTVGPVVDVWGFYRESGAMPPAVVLDSARALVGYELVDVRGETREVRLPRAGMRLDFGAIAKGYAVDRALAAVGRTAVPSCMIDLGGNIGVLGDAPGSDEWPLGLRHPRDPETPFAVVVVDSGALATSGDYERFFTHRGVRYSHIIDPRSGWPVQGVASVSVLAPTGIDSDALSTTFFVQGVERGCAAAAALPGVAVVWVVAPDGPAAESLRVVVGGSRADRVELPAGVDAAYCPGTAR